MNKTVITVYWKATSKLEVYSSLKVFAEKHNINARTIYTHKQRHGLPYENDKFVLDRNEVIK
jgi:hypothetical protein